jgi:dTDP-4-amino-4,6-dideoxygalactose transaminase
MKVSYRNLAVRDPQLKAELLQAVENILDHGRLLFGPEHQSFEEAVADYCGRQFGIGMSSGTDALFFGLKALDIGPGDEVIVTPLSWIATLNAIVLNGATPVFVDIDESLNINIDLIEAAITPATKAVLPVHFTGKMCDVDRVIDITDAHKIFLVEDGAQAFGASMNGRICGSAGILSCFSMNPMKILNAYGEAGAIVTDDEAIKERLVSLRYNGTIGKQDCHFPSLNGRLDTMQAAMLLVSLKYLPEKIDRRRAIASAYNERLCDIVRCPQEPEGSKAIYYAYTVIAERRDELMNFLSEKNIECQVQHPLTMASHTAYIGKYRGNIPRAEKLVNQILSLPNQDDLTMDELDYICDCVQSFYSN